MASRWRNWKEVSDYDACLTYIELNNTSRLPNKPVSLCLKGRGKATIDINKMSIPDIEKISVSQNDGLATARPLGRGRGRVSKESLLPTVQRIEAQAARRTKLESFLSNSKKLSDLDWPSLVVPRTSPTGPCYQEQNQHTEERNLEPNFEAPSPSLDKECDDLEDEFSSKASSDPIVKENDTELNELHTDILKGIDNSENCIVIDRVLNTQIEELENIVSEFGQIKSLQIYKNGKVLIRMNDELQCEWIISCLDGTELTQSNEVGIDSGSEKPISVSRVNDLLETS
eukprot:gene8871-9820_t